MSTGEKKVKEIVVGVPPLNEIRNRTLVKVPPHYFGPSDPPKTEYREYNRWGDEVYYQEVKLCPHG